MSTVLADWRVTWSVQQFVETAFAIERRELFVQNPHADIKVLLRMDMMQLKEVR